MEVMMKESTVKKYPAYKESGVEWLGEVPMHWDLRKLKHLFAEKRHTSNSCLYCGSISYGKVVVKDDEKIPLSTKATYQEVLKGEFIINPLNLNYDLISLRIALSDIDVVVSPGYIVLKNISELNKSYFKYLLHRYDVAYMKVLGSGVRQTISFTHISNSFLLNPPLEEQNAIAAFLDRKTTQIDKAIAQKEALIQLLKERRQILIHKAVTRGLNPDAKMKDSGVEWIGEVPEHWQVKRLKNFSFIQNGLTLGKTYFGRNLNRFPYLRVANVQLGYFDLTEITEIDLPSKEAEKFFIKVGDILVTEGGDLDKLGRGNIWKGEISNCLHQNHIFAIRVDDSVALGEFVAKVLESDIGRKYFTTTANKTTNLASTNSTKLKNIPVPLPSLIEQYTIIKYIESTSIRIDEAIFCKEKEIATLSEYKATLINGAVTGKIKVN